MSKKLTTEQFIAKSTLIHKGKYDYRLADYTRSNEPVNIICPKHGLFTQTANRHLQGRGCRSCADDSNSLKLRSNKNDVINKFKAVHGDTYTYDKMQYQRNHTKIIITCKVHGDFEQTPGSHLQGRGCKQCGRVKTTQHQIKNTPSFVVGAQKVHGKEYSYNQVSYVDSYAPVEIVCTQHGVFNQRPNDHLMGAGCPTCAKQRSKPEQEVADYVESLGFTLQRNRRDLFKGSKKEADIFIPSRNLIIEYDGCLWHSTARNSNKYNVRDKTQIAKNNGYECMHIRSDQWLQNKPLIKDLISSRLGIFTNRIGARQTTKHSLGSLEYELLCKENHLQSSRPALHKRGLYYQDELIACIGYNRDGELVRYTVKRGWQILGALSKLMKNESITYSFCDLTFFTGSSYPSAGFKLDYITKPGYCYTKGDRTVSRQSMMKHRLKDRLDKFDHNLTEVENCAHNGWYQLFDCGNAKYVRTP